MKKTTLLLLALTTGFTFAQEKKKLDHTAYDSWNSISSINQSRTGAIATYEINPHKGDGTLYIEALADGKKQQFKRGKRAKIGYNETYVVFKLVPEADTIRQLKLDKVKKDKFPKDTLAIFWPDQDSLFTLPEVKSYKLSEKGDWIAYLSENDERPDCPEKKCKLFKKKKTCKKPKTSGTTLHLLNPTTGETHTVDCVVNYELGTYGKQLVYVSSIKGETDSLSLYRMDISTGETICLIEKQLKISNLTFDDESEQFIFMHSADTCERKTFTLSYWKKGQNTADIIVDSTTTGMPENYTISEYSAPYFSENGTRIFIGTNTIVEQAPEDTLLDSEKATVDVWSGFDLKIQPQQLKEKKREEKKTYKAVYFIADKKVVQIEDETIERIRTSINANEDIVLGYSSKPYQKSMTWMYPWARDIYLVNLRDGSREMIKTEQAYTSSLAPSGDYLIYYDGPDSNWYAKSVTAGTTTNLTGTFAALFASDINGNPYVPHSEGSYGWTLIDGKEYFLVGSRYDIWALCPSHPNLSHSITAAEGKKNQVMYRYYRFDYDSTYTTFDNNLIHGINDITKAESYYSYSYASGMDKMTKLIESDHKYIYVSKAEESDQLLVRRMNFLEYPDLIKTNMAFKAITKLTTANPQQEEYNWGTVEMVNWKSFEGRDLRGLLYKPEDFDSTKSYPMIVYFYEKYTDAIHNYYSPKPTASIVYPTEYVSNGYIIFIPDIEYTPGHPAKSAYDCIVSGTDYLTAKHHWIDSTRLGLQGQSWGGYQTAQLITMTTKYKAAMAGAPVSNMFSAYGGVRWGSGLSRMFQYERSQSRIGTTIWDKPELYIENSPIFGLPNVKTPLLIMHNDGDGAVPWYQGIELYMGLRRLDQPVWLLNYNGDAHNLMQDANRRDLSIRMRQFFDYYLLGSDIPIWMDEGVPAVNKGKNYGLELKKN